MIARITRRILRKIAKPIALWWNAQLIARSEARSEYFMHARNGYVPFERAEREHQVALAAKRRQIENW